MIIRELVLFITLLLSFVEASAVCLDGRHPSPREEFGSSDAVVVAHISGHKDLTEDSHDPSGVTATLYHVKVLRRMKGTTGSSLVLRSENTSSRFPLEAGADYLLFLHKDGKAYFVDSCGNSMNKKQAAGVISELGAKE
ncbi:hypothetical protein GTP46_21935 [Duganella sp. FT135W]|uniref:Uncharacterized protein n=1 Tax=Duganella flavida TaxID=2692175 RepID=A0A6L8KDX8_9BURK|nr:hypothetical protein [Duganella flavida]MYM25295.1 hypothetical protein [Duganella flavida]